MGKIARLVVIGCFQMVLGASAAGAQSGPPVIEHIEPTSGPPGTVVYVVGRRFGQSATVTIGGQPVAVQQGLPNRLTVRIPRSGKSGRVEVRARTGSVLGPSFRVTDPPAPPVIESVEPRSGPPGTRVTIVGEHFSPRLTGNLVSFGGRPAVIRSATPVELQVIAPAVPGEAEIVVRVPAAGEAHARRPFRSTEATAIEGFEPERGAPAGKLVIRGHGFAKRAKDNRVFLNSVPLKVRSSSPTRLLVELPRRVNSGKLLVDVDGGGRAYSDKPLTVQRDPVIKQIEPLRVPAGGRMTVRGLHFGGEARAIDARLGDVRLTVVDVSPRALELELPENASSGKLRLLVNGIGPVVSAQTVTVLPKLSLGGFRPTRGRVGSVVTITGEGFSDVASQNRAKIGKQPAEVLQASRDKLVLRVPDGPSGPIRVSLPHGGRVQSEQPFVIQVPPQITGFEPQRGPTGTQLMIRGKDFGTSRRALKVSIGGHPLEVRSVRNRLVVARVTPGTPSGPLRVSLPLQGAVETVESFEVLSELRVTVLEPLSVSVGEPLTVYGQGLAADGVEVDFGGVSAAPSSSTSGKLTVQVPEGARSGNVVVRLGDGRAARSPAALNIVPVSSDPGIVPTANK